MPSAFGAVLDAVAGRGGTSHLIRERGAPRLAPTRAHSRTPRAMPSCRRRRARAARTPSGRSSCSTLSCGGGGAASRARAKARAGRARSAGGSRARARAPRARCSASNASSRSLSARCSSARSSSRRSASSRPRSLAASASASSRRALSNSADLEPRARFLDLGMRARDGSHAHTSRPGSRTAGWDAARIAFDYSDASTQPHNRARSRRIFPVPRAAALRFAP